MIKSILTVLAVLCFSLVHSQNYSPGYIVLNSGDTVRGEIDYARWNQNPEQITFRNNGSRQEYQVSLLKAFEVTGRDQYIRFPVTYQLGAVEMQEATEVYNSGTETKTVWLRVLYRGSHSLYELNTSKRNYYFIDNGSGPKELVYRVRVDNGQLQKDEQYKTLLMSYAADDDKALRRAIESADYNNSSMGRIFTLLNKNQSTFEEAPRKRSQFDIGAGASFFSYKAKGKSVLYAGVGTIELQSATYKSNAGFFIDPGITLFSQRSRTGIQSRLGLGVSSMPFDGENKKGEGSFDREFYKGTLVCLEPHFNILFSLTKDKPTRILLGPEFGSMVPLNKNNVESRFETDPNVVVVRKGFPPMSGGFITYGLNLAVAGDFGRIDIRGRKTSDMYDGLLARITAAVFSIGYSYVFKR